MLGYTTLWFVINYNTYFRLMPFFDIHISQGSVATCLRHGEIFKHEFVANFSVSLTAKEFWKQRKNFENQLIFGEVMGKSLSFFVTHCVVPETRMLADRRTDRHGHHNTPLPCWGRSNNHAETIQQQIHQYIVHYIKINCHWCAA